MLAERGTSSAASAAATTLAVVTVDLVTKALVAGTIPRGAAVAVDRAGWLIVRGAENCGGAGGLIPRLPLVVYLAVVGLLASHLRGRPGFGLVLGGAVGNVASIALTLGPSGLALTAPGLLGPPTGCAVDWLQIGAPLLGVTPGPGVIGAPIFNLADVALVAGVLAARRGQEPESAAGWAGLAAGAVAGILVIGSVLHLVRVGLLGR